MCIFLLFLCGSGIAAGWDAYGIPADYNGDDALTGQELRTGILEYLSASPALTREDIRDAAHVYLEWNGTPKPVSDSVSDHIVLYRPVRRVVVFNGEAAETLRAIGFDPEKIVATDKYTQEKSSFFPEHAGRENIGSVWSPDMEKVLSMHPDTVFLYATISTTACDEIGQKLTGSYPDIRVFRFDCFNPRTYPEEIRKIGLIVDKEEGANDFAQFYSSVMDTIGTRVSSIAEKDRVRVYFEYWNDYKTVAGAAGYNEKIELAGGMNIFRDEAADYPEIDPEAVIVRNPEVIIKLAGKGLEFGGYAKSDIEPLIAVRQSLLARPGWNQLAAVQNDRVYIIHSDILGSSQHFIGTAYLARWFYPDLFADLNPAVLHQDYLDRFQRLPFDLASEGAFVYPE
ncbi:MAG: ABC transporter substrate-binding protein [Methanoculleus sp. SDB]|nr:MAG: ABC transporter substrate-binding protein [Methanoculleus sp. SDB]